MKHLGDFLLDNPHGTSCSSAGHPAYGGAVKIMTDNATGEDVIGATYYSAYHKILKTSDDFISAMDWAYHLADDMTDHLRSHSKYSPEIEVFPYRCVPFVCAYDCIYLVVLCGIGAILMWDQCYSHAVLSLYVSLTG